MRIILQTQRLLLAELQPSDSDFILALVNSPGWLQYIGDRNIRTIEAAEQYILLGPMASYARYEHGLYLVTTIQDTIPVGICGLLKREELDYPDIGFALLPECTGKGYALEAAQAILAHAKQVLHYEKILAITKQANDDSVKLLTRLGLVLEKKTRLSGGTEELLLYSTI